MMRRHGGLVVCALFMAFAVGILVLGLGLSRGLSEGIIGAVLPRLPIQTVEVLPRGDLLSGVLGQSRKPRLSEADLAALAAVPGVGEVIPRVAAAFPATGSGGKEVLGRDLRGELIIYGLNEKDGQPGAFKGREFKKRAAGEPVPVLVSTHLITLYNNQVAPNLGLIQISPRVLEGLIFDAQLGASMIGPDRARQIPMSFQVVGTSTYAPPFGITVPLSWLHEISEKMGVKSEGGFDAAWVRLEDGGALHALTERARARGMRIEEGQAMLGRLVSLSRALLLGIALLLLLLSSAITLFALAARMEARRHELALLRALGATRAQVMSVVLKDAVLIAVLAFLGGLGVGVLLGHRIEEEILRFLDLGVLAPQSLFILGLSGHLAAAGASALAALIGASLAMIRVLGIDPATLLRAED
jgi:hypothetical protein